MIIYGGSGRRWLRLGGGSDLVDKDDVDDFDDDDDHGHDDDDDDDAFKMAQVVWRVFEKKKRLNLFAKDLWGHIETLKLGFPQCFKRNIT